jgi:hypothetical protein
VRPPRPADRCGRVSRPDHNHRPKVSQGRPALKDGPNVERTLKRPITGSALQRACYVSAAVYAGAGLLMCCAENPFSA